MKGRSFRRRNSFYLFAVSALALITSFKSTADGDAGLTALQRIGSGNPELGRRKSEDGRCQECHGADGMSGNAKIPDHAGQVAGYLIKQLRDFQTGERKHEIMTIMADDLSATDIADIAAYFAARKVMQGEGGNKDNPVANSLFFNGDKTGNIPACASCHGESGKGKWADNIFYPVIGGQRKNYLRTQLVNWKLGERTNSAENVMNKIAGLLSDDEIEALSNYISGM